MLSCCCVDWCVTSLVQGSIRFAMAVWCVAQQATLHSTAQHTCVLQNNATTGIIHIPNIVLAAIGGQLYITWYNLVRNSIKV